MKRALSILAWLLILGIGLVAVTTPLTNAGIAWLLGAVVILAAVVVWLMHLEEMEREL